MNYQHAYICYLAHMLDEALTIPQNKSDEVETRLYAKIYKYCQTHKGWPHGDRIIRIYRNSVKMGFQPGILDSTFCMNFNNLADVFNTYDTYVKKLRGNKMLDKQIEMSTSRGSIVRLGIIDGIDKIRSLNGLQTFIKKIGDIVNSEDQISMSKEKFAITGSDRKNIKLLGFDDKFACWQTTGYETTNKFIFQLWQNDKTLGRGDVYGDPTEQTPYCTHSREHWDDYSQKNPDYSQYWFLNRIEGIEYAAGDLTSPAVAQIFNKMKGTGPTTIYAMDDTYGDLLDNYDESMSLIGSEIASLHRKLLKQVLIDWWAEYPEFKFTCPIGSEKPIDYDEVFKSTGNSVFINLDSSRVYNNIKNGAVLPKRRYTEIQLFDNGCIANVPYELPDLKFCAGNICEQFMISNIEKIHSLEGFPHANKLIIKPLHDHSPIESTNGVREVKVYLKPHREIESWKFIDVGTHTLTLSTQDMFNFSISSFAGAPIVNQVIVTSNDYMDRNRYLTNAFTMLTTVAQVSFNHIGPYNEKYPSHDEFRKMLLDTVNNQLKKIGSKLDFDYFKLMEYSGYCEYRKTGHFKGDNAIIDEFFSNGNFEKDGRFISSCSTEEEYKAMLEKLADEYADRFSSQLTQKN